MNGIEGVWIFSDILMEIVNYIPSILAAVILLLIGWIVGKILGKVVREILKKLKADVYFKFGKGVQVSSIFALIVSWLIYLAFIQASVQVLGIEALTKFVGDVLMFIPGVLGGMIIILVGYVLAKYVEGQVVASKAKYSELMGRVIFFFTLIITISLALPFVGIDPSLINNIILILVGSIGIGIAIAVGWGLKDTVKVLAKKYAKKL